MRGLLIFLAIASVIAVVAFFCVRAIAPRLAAEPAEHTPAGALLLADLHIEQAIARSPFAEYVAQKSKELPPACGDSPLAYIKRVSAFLYPNRGSHPDWALVAPHLPPADILEPCLEAMFGRESVAFESFALTALLQRGLRWGGAVKSSEHQVVSPMYGGLVIGESKTVHDTLEVARGNGQSLSSVLASRLSSKEQTRLASHLGDGVARILIVPPDQAELRQYWSKRLPGLWPAISKLRAAAVGVSLDESFHLRAVVLANSGAGSEVEKQLTLALARIVSATELLPGLNVLSVGAVHLDGSWLSFDVSVPLSVLGMLSRDLVNQP